MRKSKILLTLTLTLGMLLTACGEKPSQEVIEEDMLCWEKYADEDITLDWYVNYSWFVTKWGGNAVSDKITEETGVSVNFVTPLGNEEEKLNSLISLDALPDIITLGWWEPQITTMIDEGMVYALNELADQYDMCFYDVADEAVLNWYRSEDGNVYQYPCSSFTPDDAKNYDNIPSNQTFLVRKDIYEAIGSPDMTTPEGFYAAVKKAKEMFPQVDGKELIPIGAHVFDETGCVSFDQMLMNFLAIPYEVDGKFNDRYTDPEYIKWLKMFRELGNEGYLMNDIFVDQRTQMSEKLAEGRYFCMLYQHTDMADQQKILYEKNKNSIYMAVDGPRNANGADYTLPITGINGWTVTLISKNCEHPDRAIAFLDYLISEHGQKLTYLGVEGVTYDVTEGNIVLKEDVEKLLNSDRKSYDSLYGADNTYWMLQDNAMQMQWVTKTKVPMAQLEEWTYPYAKYLGQYEITFSSDTYFGRINEKVERLWSKTIKKLLLAESEEAFDTIWAEFIKERDELGYEELLQEKTRRMKENKERIGIE